jgi:hypothetical protein
MYQITTHDAASQTARFRMPELCLQSIAGVRFEGRVNAGVVAARINGGTPVSFKDADLGVRAWSPPA